MKTITSVFIIVAMAAALSAQTPKTASSTATGINGYVTIDRNIVLLPQRLQSGDKIEIFDIHGRKILEEYVGGGYLEVNVSNLPRGLYTLMILRKKDIVAVRLVPLLGSTKA